MKKRRGVLHGIPQVAWDRAEHLMLQGVPTIEQITFVDRRLRWCFSETDPRWIRWHSFCEPLVEAQGLTYDVWAHANCQNNPTPSGLQQCIMLLAEAGGRLQQRGAEFRTSLRQALLDQGLMRIVPGTRVMVLTDDGRGVADCLRVAEEERVKGVPSRV